MKTSVRAALGLFCVAGTAMAECQINIDPAQFPPGFSNVRVEGCWSTYGGQPMGCLLAVVSSGGDPYMFQAVFQEEGGINILWWTRFTLYIECAGQDMQFVYEVEPYDLICPGHPWGWLARTITFPGLDPSMDCSQNQSAGARDHLQAFALEPAYPNPFNPTTTIRFTLSETSPALLSIRDCQGRLVANLLDGMLERGSHELTFDASSLASGIYLYTLEAAGSRESGKILLLK
jgi:hypothetical protein